VLLAKKLKAAVALHFTHHNFVPIHNTLRITPVVEIGMTSRVWNIHESIEFLK
jgi:hypothetical protein